LADGQSGCKQPLKEDSARLNQACKKEVSFATFLSKRKVEKRVPQHHLEASRNESPADEINKLNGWRGRSATNTLPAHSFGTAELLDAPDQRAGTRGVGNRPPMKSTSPTMDGLWGWPLDPSGWEIKKAACTLHTAFQEALSDPAKTIGTVNDSLTERRCQKNTTPSINNPFSQ